jgi:hypothetical protein
LFEGAAVEVVVVYLETILSGPLISFEIDPMGMKGISPCDT